MSILRDIFRRRLRSALTISGVAVGVFAVVVLGALAEKSSLTVEKSAEYCADKVTITEKRASTIMGFNANANRPLALEKIDELREYPGVLDVAPQVSLSLDEEALPMGTPSMVMGGFLGTERYEEPWTAAEGRLFDDTERGVVVVGPDLVKELGAEIGGVVTIRGERFEVVGIAERSYTQVDRSALIPLADGQKLLAKTLPPAFVDSVDPKDLAIQATAYVEPGHDADELASLLNRDVSGINASGPVGQRQQLGQMVTLFTAILLSVGAVALLVGCLSVVNTMMMALSERHREVGLKRALGASRRRVGLDVLAESSLIGVLGGLLGLALGAVAVALLNAGGGAGSPTLFLMTGRLAAGAVGFAVVLGGIAGVYPAWRTARMDPVSALSAR